MGSETDGEIELRLPALGTLEGGAAAGAEAADGLRLVGAGLGHQALGQGAVQVPARGSAGEVRRDAAVALAERAVQPLAPSSLHGMTFACGGAWGWFEGDGWKMQNGRTRGRNVALSG